MNDQIKCSGSPLVEPKALEVITAGTINILLNNIMKSINSINQRYVAVYLKAEFQPFLDQIIKELEAKELVTIVKKIDSDVITLEVVKKKESKENE